MPLTDTRIKTAKPTEKVYKLYDAEGLYIEVPPSGSKRWRFLRAYVDVMGKNRYPWRYLYTVVERLAEGLEVTIPEAAELGTEIYMEIA